MQTGRKNEIRVHLKRGIRLFDFSFEEKPSESWVSESIVKFYEDWVDWWLVSEDVWLLGDFIIQVRSGQVYT